MGKDIKRFLIKIIIFFIPILTILGYFEIKLRDIPNSYNTKRAFFESQLGKLEVLVLGSSHGLTGINPAFFKNKGFNLSNASQSLFYDTKITLKYIDELKKVRCVIITVSYFSLWYQLFDNTKESWRDYCYLRYWGLRYPEIKWYDSRIYSLIMLYSPRASLEYAIKLFRVNLASGLQENGWVRVDGGRSGPGIGDSLGKERVTFHESLRCENRFGENIQILKDFINECKKRNIEVVFVALPVLSTYSKYTNPEVNQMTKSAIVDLCNGYDCKYYDYSSDNRFTMRDFFDNDHMNYLGAEKFSRILNDDIISVVEGEKEAF